MGARIVIVLSTILFFVPSAVFPLLTYSNGKPQYLLFVLTLPFMGTCPFPIYGSMNSESDMYYWPVIIGVATAALGLVGFTTGNSKWATIFVAVLVLCWILVGIRLFVLDR